MPECPRSDVVDCSDQTANYSTRIVVLVVGSQRLAALPHTLGPTPHRRVHCFVKMTEPTADNIANLPTALRRNLGR